MEIYALIMYVKKVNSLFKKSLTLMKVKILPRTDLKTRTR